MFWFKVIAGGVLAAAFPLFPALWRIKELLAVDVIVVFLLLLSLASMADNYAQLRWGSPESCAKTGCDPWAKRASLIFLAVLISSGFERAWIPPMLPRYGPFPWLGVILVIGAGIMRVVAVFTLKESFTSSLMATSGLKTRGIYATLRHPSYLGAQMLAIGVALALSSFLGFLVAIGALLPLILFRIREEEKFLNQTNGSAWRTYTATTSRLLPGLY